MRKKRMWFQNEDFWRTVRPILFRQRRWEMATEDVNSIISLLKLRPGSKVLDLCCGVGRHALEFARRGYVVTGVDATATYIREARRKAKHEGLEISFFKQDMRRFRRTNTFDVVINLFTSFGYFRTQRDDVRVATHMCTALRKGGFFVIELMGKEVLARIYRPRDWYELQGMMIMEERTPSNDWSTLENRWIIVKGNRKKEFRFKLRFYSAVELCTLLKQAGFRKTDVYGDLTGAPYDSKAMRLIVVGRT